MQPDAAVPPEVFRQVCGRWVTGVAIVAGTGSHGEQFGMAVNSFTSVSLDPPLVLFCPALTSSTWPGIRSSGRFAVNVLGGRQAELARSFARAGIDRFVGARLRETGDGLPAFEGAVARLVCTIEEIHPGGDHEIVIGRVRAAEQFEGDGPLVFHRGTALRLPADVERVTR